MNWNEKIATRLVKYLTKHKKDTASIMLNITPMRTVEIRFFNSIESIIPELVIYVYDCIDVFVDYPGVPAHKRCWCFADAKNTIKERLSDLLM